MCIFCKIAAGEMPAQVVHQDAVCMAFLDADPIREGHILLIPRAHYQDADEIPQDVFINMAEVSRRLIAALKKAYRPDGYGVMQNGGRFNDVGHYHLHIFPRYENDGFGWKYDGAVHPCDASVAEKIKREL